MGSWWRGLGEGVGIDVGEVVGRVLVDGNGWWENYCEVVERWWEGGGKVVGKWWGGGW